MFGLVRLVLNSPFVLDKVFIVIIRLVTKIILPTGTNAQVLRTQYDCVYYD